VWADLLASIVCPNPVGQVHANNFLDRFFAWTEDEAAPHMPDMQSSEVTFYGELGVFHSLHCLNALRMHLDKDYYLRRGRMHDQLLFLMVIAAHAHIGTYPNTLSPLLLSGLVCIAAEPDHLA
jgi:hypothetical protein